MNTGTLIKLHRLQKGLSQKGLADGIVSVSYLSRIENHQVEPHEEIYKLLLSRLGVNLENEKKGNHYLVNLMNQWEESLLNNDLQKSNLIYNKLYHKISENDVQNKIPFFVNQIRYYILIEKMNEIPEVIKVIKPFYNDLTTKYKFYYLKHISNYYYVINDTEKAEKCLNDAIDLFPMYSSINSLEKADVYYLYGLSLSNNRKDANAIYFTEKALEIYKDHYRVKEWACCHILLGVCYRRIGNSNNALTHYEKASHLSKIHHFKNLEANIKHNLAQIYKLNENHKKAIELLKESYELKKHNHQPLFNTILEIVEIYYEHNELKKCEAWVNQGLELLDRQKRKETQNQVYYVCIKYYDYAVKGFNGDFETFIERTMSVHLEQSNSYELAVKYYEKIGNYFRNKNKYKKATYYLDKANRTYKQMLII